LLDDRSYVVRPSRILRTPDKSATVSKAVADAFEKQKALPKEGSLVVVTDIAGAGFEPATFGL
jgi:hypothetical protein